MTVHYVTHSLKTGDITIMGNIANTATVTGRTITRIGAIEGQEQQNPPAVHVNLELAEGEARGSVVLSLSLPDAIEMGLQLVAIGIENNPHPDIEAMRDRLAQLVSELDQTLQVSH
jgi:hypothetical protein